MYDKAKKIFVYIFVVCIFTSLFTGCISNRRTDEDILAYQRRITELEIRLDEINKSIGVSNERLDEDIRRLEIIQSEGEGLTNSIDGIIELFDKYQQGVEQLLRDYNEVRAELEKQE